MDLNKEGSSDNCTKAIIQMADAITLKLILKPHIGKKNKFGW